MHSISSSRTSNYSIYRESKYVKTTITFIELIKRVSPFTCFKTNDLSSEIVLQIYLNSSVPSFVVRVCIAMETLNRGYPSIQNEIIFSDV